MKWIRLARFMIVYPFFKGWVIVMEDQKLLDAMLVEIKIIKGEFNGES